MSIRKVITNKILKAGGYYKTAYNSYYNEFGQFAKSKKMVLIKL